MKCKKCDKETRREFGDDPIFGELFDRDGHYNPPLIDLDSDPGIINFPSKIPVGLKQSNHIEILRALS